VVAFEPSKQWGFLDGTLNFNPEDIRERIEMGYRETKRGIELMR
jgi:hypothetical protein